MRKRLALRNMGNKLRYFSQSLQNLSENKDFGLELKAIWLGFTAALGIWFLSAILGVLWIIIRGTGTYWFGIYLYLTGILGVLLGGLMGGARAERRGWLHGLWVGIMLGMLGIIVNLELMPHVYTWAGIGRQLLVWSLWGLAGGYVGFYLQGYGRIKPRSKKESRMR